MNGSTDERGRVGCASSAYSTATARCRYLQASTYTFDLDSDVKRRDYLIEGIRESALKRLALTTKPIDGYLDEGYADYDLGPDAAKFERLTKQETMAMRITLEHKTPIMFKGHYLAEADLEQCTGCGECVERCPFDAITIGPGHKRAVVDTDRCYGCGVCRAACEHDALALVPREGAPAGLLLPGPALA